MIQISKYEYISRCDVYRCDRMAEYSAGNPGESHIANHNYCRKCLGELVMAAQPLLEQLQETAVPVADAALADAEADAVSAQESDADAGEDIDLESASFAQLRTWAKDASIPGYIRMSKQDLVAALQAVLGSGD